MTPAAMTTEALTALRDAITPGPWVAGEHAWPEQVGCCPLVGRPYSIHHNMLNVAAATTISNARAIALTPTLIAELLTARSQIEDFQADVRGLRRYNDDQFHAFLRAQSERDAALARVRVLEEALITIRDKRQQCNRAADCQAVARAALNQEAAE